MGRTVRAMFLTRGTGRAAASADEAADRADRVGREADRCAGAVFA